MRGLRTLDARLRVHQENTQALVELFDGHSAVRALHYPGLASHPGHALAARQQHGFGAMLSLELEGGEAAVRAFVEGLQYFTLAESLGGVESLVAHPATMTHAAMSAEARAAAGISDGLLRLSVGIEHADDLVADIAAALQRAVSYTHLDVYKRQQRHAAVVVQDAHEIGAAAVFLLLQAGLAEIRFHLHHRAGACSHHGGADVRGEIQRKAVLLVAVTEAAAEALVDAATLLRCV